MVCYTLDEVLRPLQFTRSDVRVTITTHAGDRFICTGSFDYLRPRLDLLNDLLGPGEVKQVRVRQIARSGRISERIVVSRRSPAVRR
jgi:hypothetical protein